MEDIRFNDALANKEMSFCKVSGKSPKTMRNCAFSQNFDSRKLREITVFFTVNDNNFHDFNGSTNSKVVSQSNDSHIEKIESCI